MLTRWSYIIRSICTRYEITPSPTPQTAAYFETVCLSKSNNLVQTVYLISYLYFCPLVAMYWVYGYTIGQHNTVYRVASGLYIQLNLFYSL